MRTKRNPEKSLYEVDYTLPSVVIWFFGGQVPTKHNSTNTSSLTSIEVSNQKDKKGDKKLKLGISKVNIQHPENSEELSIPSGNTSTVIGNGNSYSSNLTSTKKLIHPLSLFPDVPALTDLQVFISEAILSEEGNACSFEKIYEFVSQRWRNIRRRDGTPYTTDCRRAIQANLRHNPNHIALFRRDNSKEGFWTVCTTKEESLEASKDKTSERGRNKRDREIESVIADGSTDELVGNSDVDEDASTLQEKKERRDSSNIQGKNETNSPSLLDSSSVSNGDTINAVEIPKVETTKLTELQALVCECIEDNSGSCHFDLIVHHVSKHWNSITNKNGNVDVKNAILSTLTDSKRLFKRDTKRTGWWMINADLIIDHGIGSPKVKLIKEEEILTPKSKSRTKLIKELQDIAPLDNNSDVGSPSIDTSENTGSGDESQKQKNDSPPMTELQVLIIQAIDAEGGVASFDQIYDRVSKKFDTIKRRDGTPYTSECRRAIQASLSNNPTTRPFFKKESKKGAVLWSLAKRSLEFLVDQKKNLNENTSPTNNGEMIKLEESSDSSNAEQKENDNDEEIVDNNDSEEMEEEIHDEEDYDEEMEKEDERDVKPEDRSKKQREEPKEDKHLLGNRVKRARKIKENAGKRLQTEHESSKDTRLKKRRR